jgi:hypothetical protein
MQDRPHCRINQLASCCVRTLDPQYGSWRSVTAAADVHRQQGRCSSSSECNAAVATLTCSCVFRASACDLGEIIIHKHMVIADLAHAEVVAIAGLLPTRKPCRTHSTHRKNVRCCCRVRTDQVCKQSTSETRPPAATSSFIIHHCLQTDAAIHCVPPGSQSCPSCDCCAYRSAVL